MASRKCIETTVAGRPCALNALEGSNYCGVHGPEGALARGAYDGNGGAREGAGRPLEVEAQEIWLASFSTIPNVRIACAMAGVDRKTYRNWLKIASFRDRYEEVKEDAIDRLEEVVYDLAVNGERRLKFNTSTGEPFKDPVTKEPYVEIERNANLLLRMLEAHRPEKWVRQQKIDVNKLSDDQILELIARLESEGATGSEGSGEGAGPA